MAEYNAPFFRAHETYFLALKELSGEKLALEAMRRVMERSLGAAYDAMGFEKGSPSDFARVVGGRDAAVGLHVEFQEVSGNRIVYQFHTDPFPNLRGHVEPELLDATYMDFKVSYLLGDGWSWHTTKHLWNGDSCTEHAIEKNQVGSGGFEPPASSV